MKKPPLGGSGQVAESDLNLPATEAEQFLRLLGKDPAETWFRTLKPIPGTNRSLPNVTRRGVDLLGFDAAALHADNQAGSSIYLITGDAEQATGKHKKTGKPTGCVDDLDVHLCRAVFVEWDDRPIEWQVQAWQGLGLPSPTAMVITGGKSVHCYWRLSEPMAPDEWRVLQRRLIDYAGGDKNCRNPSRLMRLPGYRYVDKETGEVTDNVAELIHQSDTTYTVAEIEACLPAPEPAPVPAQLWAGDLPPRPEADLLRALERVPEFFHDQGRRPELVDLAYRLWVEVGAARAEQLLAEHSPTLTDLPSYFTGNPPSRISSGSIWPFLREHYGVDLKRHDLKGSVRSHNRSISTSVGPTPLVASTIKPITLKAGEVVAALPQRVGTLRLNTRTQLIHAKEEVISVNRLATLYLSLSNPVETWPKDATFDAALQLATQNSFDPIAQYLQSNQASPISVEVWRRLDQFLLGIDDPIAAAFFPRYLMAAVARTRQPGCDFRQVPVLVGPQWVGKTVLGRKLFGKDYFVSGLKKLNNDDLMRCHTAWGVELAELNGLTNTADQEQLKQFISETSDVFRRPYDKAPERLDRRFLFWGTTNSAPLRDTTGNSRYVCIAVDRLLPLDRVAENRDAIWRRAVLQYEAGESWQECDQESRAAITLRNDNFSEEDPWLRPIADFLDRRKAMPNLPVHIPEILNALEIPIERHSNQSAGRVQQLAESLGWQKDRRTYLGKRVKGMWPPATSMPDLWHTAGTPPKPQPGGGSGATAIPVTPPTKEKRKDEERGVEVHPDTFSSGGVPGTAKSPNPLHGNQIDAFSWCGSSHPAPVLGVAEIGSHWDSESK